MEKKEISLKTKGGKSAKIDFLYQFDDSLPVASFKLIFKASGAVSEKTPGLARICAGVLGEGSKTLGVSEFHRKLDIRAVEISAASNFETFGIQLNCLKEHFDFGLDMLRELLSEPNLTPSVLQKLKMQTIGEIAVLKSEFDYIATCNLKALLYPRTRLAQPLIGDEASIERITMKDVREFFASLGLENLYVVLCGDVSDKNPKIAEILSLFASGKKRELPFFAPSDAKKIKIQKEQTQQAYIYFGAPFALPKEQEFIANTALFVLGSSGFGSRLMERIRVKHGLAYSVYARGDFELSRREFWGYLQTKNENLQNAAALVKEEIAKFIASGVSEAELKSAKKFLIGSAVLQKETMFKRAAIAQSEYYKGYAFGEFERNLKRIETLKLGALNDFIKSHDEIMNLSFSVICDEAAAKKGLKI